MVCNERIGGIEMQDKIKTAETTFILAWHEGRRCFYITWNCANLGGIVGFYPTIEDAERVFALLAQI